MNELASTFRQRYLQEVWRRLAREFDAAPVAVYGAGQHTSMMLHATSSLEESPNLGIILDDNPTLDVLHDVPIRRPEDVDPGSYAGVVVSSDSIEGLLSERAVHWARRAPDGSQPRVIRLYEGLPAETHREIVQPISRVLTAEAGPCDIAAGEPSGLPLPGRELRAGYARESAAYLAHGLETNHAIRVMLADNGADPAALGRILDWGCSSGRVIRHWADLAGPADVWGCDIDEEAIDWTQRYLSPPFRFFSTTLSPSIPVPDHSFDLVYGISIFTHIIHNVDAWLMELRRITAARGHVLVTIHDEHTWRRCASEPELFIARRFPGDFSQPLRDDFIASGFGSNSQTFWHTDAVRRRWSAMFEIVEIRPAAFGCGTQTGVLMTPRS